MKSTAKNIYNELSKISFDNNDLKNTWSDIDKINTYVNEALIDNQRASIAHYISPTSFSIFDEKGMLSLAEEICVRETQDKMLLNNHYTLERRTNKPNLTKPFMGISNTGSVLLNQTNSTEGGSHWVSWALLPKEYKAISGQIIKHEKYRVYFFDSFGHWKFPENLKKCITEGAEFSEKVNEGSENEKTIHRKLLPFCQEEEIDFDFIDTSNLTGQQMNGSGDCGWWAVYYALMTVYEGGIDFLNEIKGRKLSALPLRQIMNLEENTPNQLRASLQSEGGSGKKTLSEIDKQNNSSKKLKNDSGLGDELDNLSEEEVDDPGDERNDSGTGSVDSPEHAGRIIRESAFVNGSDDEDESNCAQGSPAKEMSRRKRKNPFINNELSTPTKKRHDDSTSPLLTLESETKKGNYTYCLQEKDIINVARVMYSDLYDNGLVVISNSDKPRNNTVKVFRYFNEEELERQILHFIATVVNKKSNDLLILQPLIIELEKDQWVTLVLCYCNEKYTAYYVNSLKGAGGGISILCIDKLLIHHSIKHAENFDLKISQYIQLVGKSLEQLPKHNCSWWALENARDIYKVLKESGTPSQEVNSEIIKQLKIRRDENHFKDLRKQFSDRQSREPAGELPKHLSDGSNNLDEEELNEIRLNTLSNSYCESRIFSIMYQVQLSVLCFINIFRLNKDKYPECRLSVEHKHYYPFDDLVLFDGKKNTCIQVKYKSEFEDFRGYRRIQFNHLFPKNRRYGDFSVYNYLEELIKNKSLDIDKDDIQNFVIYTDVDFDFDKDKLKKGQYELSKPESYLGSDFFLVKFGKIKFQEQQEFEFLKNCLCPDDPVDDASFYQFSQDTETEKAFLEQLSSNSNCSERKKEIIKKLYKKIVFAVCQPSIDKAFENIRKTTIKVMRKGSVSEHSIDEEEVEKTCMELEEAMLDYCANPIGTYITNKNQETFESGIKHTKKYEKSVGLGNMIPIIKIQTNVLLYSFLHMLGSDPLSEKLYFALSQRKSISNTIHFRYEGKNTYVIPKQTKEKNLLSFNLKKLFDSFYRIYKENLENIGSFIIYTNADLDLTEANELRTWFEGYSPPRFDEIELSDQTDEFGILHFLNTEGGKAYKFSNFMEEKEEEKLFCKLDGYSEGYNYDQIKEIKKVFGIKNKETEENFLHKLRTIQGKAYHRKDRPYHASAKIIKEVFELTDKSLGEKILKDKDVRPIRYTFEKKIAFRAFLDKLVFLTNQPNSNELKNKIISEISQLVADSDSKTYYAYNKLREALFTWFIHPLYYYFSKQKISEFWEKIIKREPLYDSFNKNLNLPYYEEIKKFAITVVQHRGFCHYRDLLYFLCETKEGRDIFFTLRQHNLVNGISSIMWSVGIGCVSTIKEVYYCFFNECGEEKNDIPGFTRCNLTGILSRSKQKGKEAYIKLRQWCFEYILELNNFISLGGFRFENLSSMLGGSGIDAGSNLKALHDLCFEERNTGEWVITQYLDDFLQAGFKPKNLSSILASKKKPT